MRILAVSGLLPYPPRDGRGNRTWHLLRHVARRADVTVATWLDERADDAALRTAEDEVGPVLAEPLVGFRQGLPSRVARQARFVSGGVPPYVQAMRDVRGGRRGIAAFGARLVAAHRDRPFDVVLLEEEALAVLGLPHLEAPLVVQRHNVFEQLIGALRRSPPRRAGWLVERPGWRRFDRSVLADADLVVTPTPEAAAHLRRIDPGRPVAVVNNGVDVPPLATSPSEGHDLAFIGWMRYAPNVDAVRWYAERIRPHLADRDTAAVLRVIGRDPSPSVRQLDGVGIRVVGEVDNLTAACEGVRAGVVPLRAGMGIKTKTLELMSMGLPVVATTVGAEGLAVSAEDGVLVADDERAFAAHVDALLDDGEAADRLGAAARRFVLRHHSWSAIADAFVDDLERLVAPTD